MKKTTILFLSGLFLAGCNSATTTTVNVNQITTNSANSGIVSSHSETTATNSFSTPTTTNGGSPMTRAIDVSEMTAAIEKADKAYKAKSTDAKLKTALAEAYFARAFALTDAAQYRAALGDFRKGLKLDPTNAEAKSMHDQIINIFKSINREPPKEGEEPAPMPFDKNGNQSSNPTASGEQRIDFAKGATEAVASGTLNGYDDSNTFVIKVDKGQTLRTGQDKSDSSLHYITANVTDPSGAGVGDSDASCNNRREITPTVAGDYKIQVIECKKADAWKGDFKLKVTVK